MKYIKLFFMIFLATISLQAKTPLQRHYKIEKIIETWLLQHFTKKLYDDLTYTEELCMNIKQHLLTNNYHENIPHKDLKEIIKEKIISIKQKKYRSRYWFLKHKKELINVIKHYFKTHKLHNQTSVYAYLHTSKHTTCQNLQQTMKRADILPIFINEQIKALINQLKPKGI